jgi:hypothetical protein
VLHTDCCDGSDEYDGKVKCPDTCYALGEDTRNAKRLEIEAFKKVWSEPSCPSSYCTRVTHLC